MPQNLNAKKPMIKSVIKMKFFTDQLPEPDKHS